MEGSNTTLKSVDGTLEYEIYENSENLPYNEQSLQMIKDIDNNGKKKNIKKIYGNIDNILETYILESSEEGEAKTQTFSVCRGLEDSHMKYSYCGEPIKFQNINIDFTPVPGVDDNAFLQQKCIDFWKFVNEHQNLQNFEKVNHSSANESIIDKASVSQGFSEEIENTAINHLQRSGISRTALGTKFVYGYCDHSNNDYYEETKVEQRQVKCHKRPNFCGPQTNFGFKSRCHIKSNLSSTRTRGLDEVDKLCHEMEQFDLSHPQSMEPPMAAPSLNNKK